MSPRSTPRASDAIGAEIADLRQRLAALEVRAHAHDSPATEFVRRAGDTLGGTLLMPESDVFRVVSPEDGGNRYAIQLDHFDEWVRVNIREGASADMLDLSQKFPGAYRGAFRYRMTSDELEIHGSTVRVPELLVLASDTYRDHLRLERSGAPTIELTTRQSGPSGFEVLANGEVVLRCTDDDDFKVRAGGLRVNGPVALPSLSGAGTVLAVGGLDLDDSGHGISENAGYMTLYTSEGRGSDGVQIRGGPGTGFQNLFFVQSNGVIRVNRNLITSTTAESNMRIFTGDTAQESRVAIVTSSGAAKADVRPVTDDEADRVLAIEPVRFRSKLEGDRPDWSHYGGIAEQIADVDPRLVSWVDDDGTARPQAIQWSNVTALLVAKVKDQQRRLDEQQAAIEALTARLDALESRR